MTLDTFFVSLGTISVSQNLEGWDETTSHTLTLPKSSLLLLAQSKCTRSLRFVSVVNQNDVLRVCGLANKQLVLRYSGYMGGARVSLAAPSPRAGGTRMSLAVPSLRAGSPLSHARERRRAKRSSGKKSTLRLLSG